MNTSEREKRQQDQTQRKTFCTSTQTEILLFHENYHKRNNNFFSTASSIYM